MFSKRFSIKMQGTRSDYDQETPVIIQSLFRETTRNGKHTIRLVLLALTKNLLMIASSHSFGACSTKSRRQNIIEIRSLHPLDSVMLTIFKKTKRQTLKLCIHNRYERYFELDRARGTHDLWKNWCKNILQLNQGCRKITFKKSLTKTTSYNASVVNANWDSQKQAWNDKNLYLGTKRAIEDNSRPMPVQGLGPPEDIKLIHLKPQYFGCWGQTEHWVQCERSKQQVE